MVIIHSSVFLSAIKKLVTSRCIYSSNILARGGGWIISVLLWKNGCTCGSDLVKEWWSTPRKSMHINCGPHFSYKDWVWWLRLLRPQTPILGKHVSAWMTILLVCSTILDCVHLISTCASILHLSWTGQVILRAKCPKNGSETSLKTYLGIEGLWVNRWTKDFPKFSSIWAPFCWDFGFRNELQGLNVFQKLHFPWVCVHLPHLSIYSWYDVEKS